jgi:hypothetical protein
LLALTVPIHCSYARKHGFDYQAHFSSVNENPLGYSKIRLLLDNVDKYEYLVWFDADVMITDDTVDLRGAFKNDLNAVLFNKPHPHYNAGIFYFKGNENVRVFLTDLLSRPVRDKWFEQRIFNDMIVEEKYKGLFSPAETTFNCTLDQSAFENPIVTAWHSALPPDQKLIYMVREAKKRKLMY